MTSAVAVRPTTCPALQSGDRMDAAEFHWRYSLRPDVKNAELINGVVYVSSSVNLTKHGGPHFDLIGEFSVYRKQTPGVIAGDNSSILLGGDNEPQPDVLLCWDREHGGRLELDADGNLISAPDLAAEVSYSSRSYDLHDKKELYRRIGVREYLVWQVEEGRIDWWRLDGGAYVPLSPEPDGTVKSMVFPGLALDIPALISRFPATKLPARPELSQDGGWSSVISGPGSPLRWFPA